MELGDIMPSSDPNANPLWAPIRLRKRDVQKIINESSRTGTIRSNASSNQGHGSHV